MAKFFLGILYSRFKCSLIVKNDSGMIPFDADTKIFFESNFFDEMSDDSMKGDGIATVSYTHLTLPTIYSV